VYISRFNAVGAHTTGEGQTVEDYYWLQCTVAFGPLA